MIREAGLEAAAAAYAEAQPWGTPDQIVEKLAAQKAVMGDLDINVVFSYAGLPFDKVEDSFTLFSKEVLPALRDLSARADLVRSDAHWLAPATVEVCSGCVR